MFKFVWFLIILFWSVETYYYETHSYPLGRGYYEDGTLFYNDKCILPPKSGEPIVPCWVKWYDNHYNYIVVKQIVHNHKPFEPDSVYYWYIDKNTKDVYGPATFSEMYSFLEEKDLERLLLKKHMKP